MFTETAVTHSGAFCSCLGGSDAELVAPATAIPMMTDFTPVRGDTREEALVIFFETTVPAPLPLATGLTVGLRQRNCPRFKSVW